MLKRRLQFKDKVKLNKKLCIKTMFPFPESLMSSVLKSVNMIVMDMSRETIKIGADNF
jgi:hypothetical protein